jgi:hypothetical protein
LYGVKGNNEREDVIIKRSNAVELFRIMMEGIISRAKPKGDLIPLAQGIHYCDLSPEMIRKNMLYFVNGKKIFRGQFNDQDDIDWVVIDNVLDGNIIFENLSSQNRWSFVNEVSDLYNAQNIDLQSIFKDIKNILDGWKFENHDIIAPYLAAYIMSVPIMRAVGNVNITILTGETDFSSKPFSENSFRYLTDLAILPGIIFLGLGNHIFFSALLFCLFKFCT